MPYSVLRGGHAPGYLRDDFETDIWEFIESECDEAGESEEFDELIRRLHKMTGTLWNCSDITSKTLEFAFERLDLPEDPEGRPPYGGSYARVSRILRQHLEERYPTLVGRNVEAKVA